jgi:hypothetical protein
LSLKMTLWDAILHSGHVNLSPFLSK